jgi:hypothetical protein
MSAGQADRGDASPVAERTRPACGRLDTRCGPSQGQAGWTTDAQVPGDATADQAGGGLYSLAAAGSADGESGSRGRCARSIVHGGHRSWPNISGVPMQAHIVARGPSPHSNRPSNYPDSHRVLGRTVDEFKNEKYMAATGGKVLVLCAGFGTRHRCRLKVGSKYGHVSHLDRPGTPPQPLPNRPQTDQLPGGV